MITFGAENKTIRRVSFAKTIQGCLMALGRNLKGETLYVHELVTNKHSIALVDSGSLHKQGKVPDALITGEVWVLEDIKLRLVEVIKVGAAKEPHSYTYRKDGIVKKAELWSWDYEKIQ